MKLNITEKEIKILEQRQALTGEVNVEKLQFDFSDEWNDLIKIVVFTWGDDSVKIMLEDDNCNMPEFSNSGVVTIGVYGFSEESGILSKRLSPKPVDVYIGTGSYKNANDTKQPQLDAIEQLKTGKQDKLTAGDNITIDGNNVISASASTPQIQSDYSQNDETALDYIKNRPFYTNEINIDFPNGTEPLETIDITDFTNSVFSYEVDRALLKKVTTDTGVNSADELPDKLMANVFEETSDGGSKSYEDEDEITKVTDDGLIYASGETLTFFVFADCDTAIFGEEYGTYHFTKGIWFFDLTWHTDDIARIERRTTGITLSKSKKIDKSVMPFNITYHTTPRVDDVSVEGLDYSNKINLTVDSSAVVSTYLHNNQISLNEGFENISGIYFSTLDELFENYVYSGILEIATGKTSVIYDDYRENEIVLEAGLYTVYDAQINNYTDTRRVLNDISHNRIYYMIFTNENGWVINWTDYADITDTVQQLPDSGGGSDGGGISSDWEVITSLSGTSVAQQTVSFDIPSGSNCILCANGLFTYNADNTDRLYAELADLSGNAIPLQLLRANTNNELSDAIGAADGTVYQIVQIVNSDESGLEPFDSGAVPGTSTAFTVGYIVTESGAENDLTNADSLNSLILYAADGTEIGSLNEYLAAPVLTVENIFNAGFAGLNYEILNLPVSECTSISISDVDSAGDELLGDITFLRRK